MDDVPNSLAHADELSLTPEERSAGRMALEARLALSLTPEEKLEGRRALQSILYADPAPASAWSWFRMPLRLPATAFSILLLLGLSGGGLAYAAEGAMPGDALYGVKIYVNEALRAKFQFTAVDRARWAVTRLQRRMDELNRLEARGIPGEELDVALGDHVERAAHEVEEGVEALPAAAAERAAMRTAVNAAIGSDQDSMRRASKINRVLKALKERADGFDAPTPAKIAPVPSVNARARAANEVDVRIDAPDAAVDAKVDADADARSDAGHDGDRGSSKASSPAASSSPAAHDDDNDGDQDASDDEDDASATIEEDAEVDGATDPALPPVDGVLEKLL